jgi:hypothetical protein
MTFWLEVQ